MITAISAEDLPRIREIEKASYPTPWSDRMFLQEFSNPMGLSLGWKESGVLVGYIFGWILFEDLHINNIAVDPRSRGRGLGARLLTALIDEARPQGITKVMLEVRPSNAAALALYAKFGFKQVSVRRGYYDDTGEDGVILIAKLDERAASQLTPHPLNAPQREKTGINEMHSENVIPETDPKTAT